MMCIIIKENVTEIVLNKYKIEYVKYIIFYDI